MAVNESWAVALLLHKHELLKVVSSAFLGIAAGNKDEAIGAVVRTAREEKPGFSIDDIIALPIIVEDV